MRLLLIEDDPALVRQLKPELERSGFAVDVSDNGVEGEYLGNENLYDIVILDLGLPQRSGLEVLKNWRSGSNRLPVIILTARDAWHERVEGFEAGADDYIGKPFHVEELLARIKAVLHRLHQQQSGDMLEAGGIRLDEKKQSVLLEDGSSIELTGTEFRLLRYFLLHPDKILSKTTLTEHTYEQDADKDSNVIEVYVRRLREKIGKDKIETRRGQGYIFRGQSK
jgi:DNA-binding response OmpR family regulator